MNSKGLINTIVGVVLTAIILAVGGLYSQVQTNRSELSALKAKMDFAVSILEDIREQLRER